MEKSQLKQSVCISIYFKFSVSEQVKVKINDAHPWSVKFAYEGISRAEVEMFASSLLLGSRLSSFSMSSRLGMSKMAAIQDRR